MDLTFSATELYILLHFNEAQGREERVGDLLKLKTLRVGVR